MVKDLVPEVHFYDQDFVDMYDRTWVWLDEEWHQSEQEGIFPEGWYSYLGKDKISFFETMISSLFLVYSNQNYSPYSMMDYFYARQEESGRIAELYSLEDNSPIIDNENPLGITLPLLSYVEYNFYHKMGNKKRLKEIVVNLEKYFYWMQANFQDSSGLYKVPLSSLQMKNLPRDNAVYTVDFNSLVASYALYMSYIGDILNDKELSFRYKRIYFSLKTRINSMMWDSEQHFYFDLDGNYERVLNKHIGAYYTLLAEIPNEEYASFLIDDLKNDKEFGTDNPFPTLPVSNKYYDPNGNGYCGGVVPFCTFLVIKGLMNYNSFVFARECSIRSMYFILDTLHPGEGVQGDVWEIYKPSQEGPATGDNRKHYLPMIGLITINLVIENIIGLSISLPRKTVSWTMQTLEAMGIEDLSLKKNFITILSNKNVRGWEIRLESEKLYYFTIQILEEDKKKTLPIPSGKCSLLIDKL